MSRKTRLGGITKRGKPPNLFRKIRERFPDIPVPPEGGVINHLNRAIFNQTAVPKAARTFLDTARFVEELAATKSHGTQPSEGEESEQLDTTAEFGGASLGDMIQWEYKGAL